MKEYYKSKREYWNSEIALMKTPKFWKLEAKKLWLSARVLYDQQNDILVNHESKYPFFFGWNVIRMLIGFSLENLLKAYLISKIKRIIGFPKKGILRLVIKVMI